MPFSRFAFISVAGLSIATVLFVYVLFTVTPEEKTRYEEQIAIPLQKNGGSARQERSETEKALLLTQGDERRYAVIYSRSSILIFSEEEGFKEQMAGIRLLYQEALLPDGQELLSMTAEQASYDEKEQKLQAEGVTIERYRLMDRNFPPSLTLPPYFTGKAEKVTVLMTGEGPEIEAEGLKGEILP